MQLQLDTHYAVRILLHLFKNPDIQKVQSLAETVGITQPLLNRIALKLKQHGLLISMRGGYKLGKPASEISFYDVFLAIEKKLCVSHCFEVGKCEDGHCKAHELLLVMQGDMMRAMSSRSIADLA